jgi:hypothetical protein
MIVHVMYNYNVYIFLPNIGTVMKKLFLMASCLILSDACVGGDKPETQLKYARITSVHALPDGHYELGGSIAHGLYTVNDLKLYDEDCPVPSPKKKSPDPKDMEKFDLEDYICPVSPVQPRR